MGGAEEPPEIKQRRTVYERPSCKESVFGKMLAIKTIALCSHYLQHIKAVVNTVGGLLASRRVFCRLPLLFFLFLFDKFRRKHLLKHAKKTTIREHCCIVPVTT